MTETFMLPGAAEGTGEPVIIAPCDEMLLLLPTTSTFKLPVTTISLPSEGTMTVATPEGVTVTDGSSLDDWSMLVLLLPAILNIVDALLESQMK
ncbi:hypothetical protein Busp01_05410 [Trinickia caryophylli]|nr:hypothetical protein Busp01_05410 [Trinickia caryophylli]